MRNILRTGAVLALGMLGGLAAASDYIVARSTDASIVKGTALLPSGIAGVLGGSIALFTAIASLLFLRDENTELLGLDVPAD